MTIFQELLKTLKTIADKHQVSMANVAVKFILNQPAVARVIIGTRLKISEHLQDNSQVVTLNLDGKD